MKSTEYKGPMNDLYQTESMRIKPTKFTCEFDAFVSSPNGETVETFIPNTVYYVHLEPGTTEDFYHVWLGDVKVIFDVPAHFIKK